MYVDRKLAGVQAVQTLSRLNRTCAGKEDTFVLDFANEAQEIQASFQPFYETTTVAESADLQQLYDLQHDLDSAQIYTADEVEQFARVQAFVRLYAFLSQVMPFADRDLEVRYSFARFLLKRLPRGKPRARGSSAGTTGRTPRRTAPADSWV